MYEFLERFMTDMDVFLGTIFVGGAIAIGAFIIIVASILEGGGNDGD